MILPRFAFMLVTYDEFEVDTIVFMYIIIVLRVLFVFFCHLIEVKCCKK